MVSKLTTEQRKQLLEAYVCHGQASAGKLAAEFGVAEFRGRCLAWQRGVKPLWKSELGPKRLIEKPPLPKRGLPSQAFLLERLHYNPDTGVFRRISGPLKGKIAGSLSHGYIVICVGPPAAQFAAHRLAWVCMTGREPVDQIDHVDGNRSNNKWANLREASLRQNSTNTKRRRDNKSRFKGVCWSKRNRKWLATLKTEGVLKFLGYFDDPKAAHEAYRAAAVQYHGEFARFE